MLLKKHLLLLGLLTASACLVPSLHAQTPDPALGNPSRFSRATQSHLGSLFSDADHTKSLLIPPLHLQNDAAWNAFAPAPRSASILQLPSARFSEDFGVIERMKAAVTFLDTPFAEQVDLPVASLWGGRMKLRGFESNITTADILWGLPGAGSWSLLNMSGGGFLAVRVPQTDQAYGIHLSLNLRGMPAEENDNALVHSFGYLLRSGRDFLHR